MKCRQRSKVAEFIPVYRRLREMAKRKTPLVTVSAVVTPSIYEEIDRLASSKQVSRSQMVRELLEEKLTERANERMEDAYDRLEKRLARMEERFAALMTKIGRASAQNLYLTQVGLKYGHRSQDEYLNKHLDDSYTFAGKFLESKAKKKQRGESS